MAWLNWVLLILYQLFRRVIIAIVRIVNDGKEKDQSFEASFHNTNIDKFLENGEYISDLNISSLSGYGRTSEEAFNNLRDNFDYILSELLKIRQQMDNGTIKIK